MIRGLIFLCLILSVYGASSDYPDVNPLDDISEAVDKMDESEKKLVEKMEEQAKILKNGIQTLVMPGIPRNGPTLFYDGDSFLMQVVKPIQVSIFRGSEGSRGRPISVVSLDAPAISVKGSMIDADGNNFQVNIDWKRQNFGDSIKITSIQINMKFVKDKGEYTLKAMEIVQLHIGGKQIISNPLQVTTSYGYKMYAPLGLAFCCYSPGMFEPAENDIQSEYTVGITLPDVRLQAFGLKHGGSFGPEWGCGELLSIGLWVGLIVTFFFAVICFYGFTMLANVQTMDRFDDPKGKAIHIPHTD